MAWLLIVGPWLVRNAVSVGKWGLTEEYGSATLIERFAFNDMSVREFVLAFPYCLPEIGAPIVDAGVRSTGHGTVRLRHTEELLSMSAARSATSWSRLTVALIR